MPPTNTLAGFGNFEGAFALSFVSKEMSIIVFTLNKDFEDSFEMSN